MDIHSDPLLGPLERTAEGVCAGDCVLVEKLGQGGMGAVYLGRHTHLHIDVAVKVLPFHAATTDSTAVSRFQKEARSTVRIEHPNIVRIFDVSEEKGVHYLVMEYVDGETSAGRIEREGPLPERDALEIAIAAGEALAAAHAEGILHRDVKPANILLRFKDGRVKVADLGLAKAVGGEGGETTGLTATGAMLGTPAYMSPEQAEDASRADGRTDIYSLGATLYALLSGRAPFQATQLFSLLKKVTGEEPEELGALREDVGAPTLLAVKRLMRKDPVARPQTMADAVELLRGCLEGAPTEGARGLARPQMAGRRKVVVEEPTPTPAAPRARTLDDVTPSQVRRRTVPTRRAEAPVVARLGGGKKLAIVLGILAALGAAGGAAAYLWSRPRTSERGHDRAAGAVRLPVGRQVSPEARKEPARVSEGIVRSRPGDREASPFLTQAKKHLGPAPALTIDLGGGVKMEMVYIKPGRFMMGSEQGEPDEKPAHEVVITEGFYLGKHEVTQEQYERVMGTNPSQVKGARNPVETVSWNDVAEFCRKLSGRTGREVRLPTEAEWEYACRAGSTGEYCFGSDVGRLGEHAWYESNSGKKTHPVGQKRPNAWGLHDCHGNVWEWCADWYDGTYYGKSPRNDPKGPDAGSARVLRGGSGDCDAYGCRSAFRDRDSPASRGLNLGFRAAASLFPCR